jgi:cobalt-zinc-cadmium efflux system membrane fusion protein
MRHRWIAAGFLALVACDDHPREHEHAHEDQSHSEDGEHAVALTPEAMRSAQIEIATATQKPLEAGIKVSARLALAQHKMAHVTSRVPGRIDAIRVKLGDRVKKGAVLAVFESPELGRARADYQAAVTRLRVARATHQREEELVKKGISAERVLREAEAALAAANAEVDAADAHLHAFGLSESEIKSLKRDEHYTSSFPLRTPLDGKVLQIEATVGQSVEGTAHLFTVGDPSELWALLDIFENQLAMVKVGQTVALTVTALPEERFVGTVEYIGDVVEEATRTIHVRVVVPNADGRLKPGMFASAEIASASTATASADRKAAVVVPREAVQTVGEQAVVFVPDGPNRFKPMAVFTGESSAKEVEILRGLEPGAKFVVRGAFILKSELSKESLGEGHAH